MDSLRLKVLLIDDDEDDCILLRELLSQVSSVKYDVEWVKTYDSALEAIRSRDHDACLLDYHLGEQSGLELLHEVTRKGYKIPVIVLTGQGDYNVDLTAMKAGAADYLVKPQLSAPILERSIRYAVERKRAQQSIENEYLFRKAIENSLLAGIIAFDLEGRQSYVNSAFCKMVGWTEEELLGQEPPFVYWPEEERERITAYFKNIITGKKAAEEFEVTFRRRNEERLNVLVLVSLLTDNHGKRIGWIASINDITQRKRMERALKESERQLRSLSSQLLLVQEKERIRLAQQLHDSIGQSLAAIKLGMEDTLKAIRKGKSGEIAKALKPLISLAQESLEEVREMYMGLRPSILDDFGAIAAIAWYCREFEKIYPNVKIEKHIEIKEEEIPKHLKVFIYRNAQEALDNVGKHSRANHGFLSLTKGDDKIDLTVMDNGIGFDPDETFSLENPGKGVGLASMKERTELSGGSLTIESGIGQRTLICASWPLNSEPFHQEKRVYHEESPIESPPH